MTNPILLKLLPLFPVDVAKFIGEPRKSVVLFFAFIFSRIISNSAQQSQTHIFSQRDGLARLSKDSRLVADYFHQVHSLCDELSTIGSPISNE